MRNLWFAVLFLFGFQALGQHLYPVSKKRKWGYMDGSGKMIIDFKYDLAQSFNEGFASVALGNMPCLIDVKENRVIDTGIYQFIGPFSDGLTSVMDYKFRRYYLNDKGKVVLTLPSEIYDARPFYNGLARVGKKVDIVVNKFGVDVSNLGYKFAYIKKDGSYLTEFIFDDGEDFYESPVRVLIGQNFGLIDMNGKLIGEPNYSTLSNFNDSLAVFSMHGKFGYVNKLGVVVIEPQFTYAKEFNEGFAAIESEGKMGFINKSGILVIPALYDDVRPFAEGRAAVLLENKWAFIDAKGNYIYQPTFQEAGYFNEGLCPVKLKGKWGAIDKEGHIVVPFEFDNIGIFEDGLAEVIFRGINLYVNRRGMLLPIVD